MSIAKTTHWQKLPNGDVQCLVCPRCCKMKNNGDRGFCYGRGRYNDEVVLFTYGKTTGLAADPIEKKPLYHFLPTTTTLSFGTLGCNLACKFCQNWQITRQTEDEIPQRNASPEHIVSLAQNYRVPSIAFTYNDPVVFLEYAKDTAQLANQNNIKTVAVTAGYINPKAREDFFSFINAANVDLKGFNDSFYKKLSKGHLEPVLETLEYIANETNTWLEITNLLIPGQNDSEEDLDKMTAWIAEKLGPQVPIHFSAFYPQYQMSDLPPTSVATLKTAKNIAKKNGLKYVYLGNVTDDESSSTECKECGNLLIKRSRFIAQKIGVSKEGKCIKCGTMCDGVFL
ncbi:MAG: AmmeMemoRadiSam system radical SAM enzyme [Bacteriovoracia bacterium]